jgi:hypothetical protein
VSARPEPSQAAQELAFRVDCDASLCTTGRPRVPGLNSAVAFWPDRWVDGTSGPIDAPRYMPAGAMDGSGMMISWRGDT